MALAQKGAWIAVSTNYFPRRFAPTALVSFFSWALLLFRTFNTTPVPSASLLRIPSKVFFLSSDGLAKILCFGFWPIAKKVEALAVGKKISRN
jgi:hypothetical protein